MVFHISMPSSSLEQPCDEQQDGAHRAPQPFPPRHLKAIPWSSCRRAWLLLLRRRRRRGGRLWHGCWSRKGCMARGRVTVRVRGSGLPHDQRVTAGERKRRGGSGAPIGRQLKHLHARHAQSVWKAVRRLHLDRWQSSLLAAYLQSSLVARARAPRAGSLPAAPALPLARLCGRRADPAAPPRSELHQGLRQASTLYETRIRRV